MTTRRVRPAWRVALAAAALASATRATAGLGERAESMAEDRKALGAEAREPVAHERYSVERMQSPANEVREFVSPAGIVFAVAWDGISHPDLSRLLGAYALEYRRAAAKPGAIGRRGRRVRTDGLVVEVMSASNAVFPDLGGPSSGGGTFDWGLPFFLGRAVYVGFEGRASPLGTGPYVAH